MAKLRHPMLVLMATVALAAVVGAPQLPHPKRPISS